MVFCIITDRVQWLCGCVTLREGQQGVISDIAATLTHAFTHFRGYVPSDIIAGMALHAKEQRESEVHSYYNNKYIPIQIVPKKNILNMRCKNVHHKLSPCVQMHFGAKYDTTISLCLPGISTWSVVIAQVVALCLTVHIILFATYHQTHLFSDRGKMA